MAENETYGSSFTVQAPENFSFCPMDWPRWKRRFERFRIASGLDKRSEEEQVNTLIYLMGDQADDIFLSFSTLSYTNQRKYIPVLQAFEKLFVVKHNVIYERAKFNSRCQLEGETIEDFITALYLLSENCLYTTLRDEMLRDRLVVGVRDKRLSERLQLEPELTLEKAIQTVRQHDAVRKQQQDLSSSHTNSAPVHVNRITRNKTKTSTHTQSKEKSTQFKTTNTGFQCPWCGSQDKHPKQNCPAKGKQCNKCKRWNHYSKVCKSIRGNNRKIFNLETERDEDQPFFLGTVTENNAITERWTADVSLNGTKITFMLDTGAPVDVIPFAEYKSKFLKPNLKHTNKKLSGPSGESLKVMGFIESELCYGQSRIVSNVYVVDKLKSPLLSLYSCHKLNIIQRINTMIQKSSVNIGKEFPRVFQTLGCLQGEYTIQLKPGARPFAISTARRSPIPLKEKIKQKLDEMIKLNVIRRVEEPTEWCAPMVVVTKPNGDIRICVDLTRLNLSIRREIHPMPVAEHTLAQMGSAKIFTKLDANSGFWQIKLSSKSQCLTTFLTPYGRYCFLRMPYGICSAPEHFQKKLQRILEGLNGYVVQMDDLLVYGNNIDEHDKNLRAVLKRLDEDGVTLNKEKCQVGVSSITFLGHRIDEHGLSPCPSKIQAVQNFPSPQNVREVRQFLGLVNYLGKFVPNLSSISHPLNELLKTQTDFIWSWCQEEAFEKLKRALTSAPILKMYDPTHKTTVSSDASSYGLGAVLLQVDSDGIIKPVAYASRTLTESEKKYAQIEKEALGIKWSCERFRDYITGIHFTVETDHKPLISIFSNKNLDELTPRIQRLRMKMMGLTFNIVYTPGKDLVVADALSRHPTQAPEKENEDEEIESFVNSIVEEIPASTDKLNEIQNAQMQDSTTREIMDFCKQGWPSRSRMSQEARLYYNDRQNLAVNGQLLMHGSRLVIPPSMRNQIIQTIHTGHLGIVKCKVRMRESVWWPGCAKQLEEFIRRCTTCVQYIQPRHQPLITSAMPERAWHTIAMDLFSFHGKTYLLVSDFFSRFPEVEMLVSQTSRSVIEKLKIIFSRFGIPEIVRTDNGPQFIPVLTSEFSKFAKTWGFKHVTSSPHFPQSNGFIEAAVKTIKMLLKKNEDDLQSALLEYRATPLANGLSPAELLMGRRIRSKIPMSTEKYKPKLIDENKINVTEKEYRRKQADNFNRRHGVVREKQFRVGDVVWIRDIQKWGRIQSKADVPRSFWVTTSSGIYRRNTFHLNNAHRNDIPYKPEEVFEGKTPQNPIPTTSSGIKPKTSTSKEEMSEESVSDAQKVSSTPSSQPYFTRSGRAIKLPDRYRE